VHFLFVSTTALQPIEIIKEKGLVLNSNIIFKKPQPVDDLSSEDLNKNFRIICNAFSIVNEKTFYTQFLEDLEHAEDQIVKPEQTDEPKTEDKPSQVVPEQPPQPEQTPPEEPASITPSSEEPKKEETPPPTEPEPKQEEKPKGPGILDIIMHTMYIGNALLVKHSLEGADISIEPQVRHIGAGDFHRADECIIEGERAAWEQIPKIRMRLGIN